MALNILQFGMAIPTVTREYSPGSRLSSRKPMRLHPTHEMILESPALGESNSVFPIQHVRSLNFLHRTLERPPEDPHMSRRTLMSP